MTLLALFLAGVILWVIGKLMEPGEQRKRDERVRQRTAEVVAQLEAGWRAQDARMAAVVREASRPEGPCRVAGAAATLQGHRTGEPTSHSLRWSDGREEGA